MLIKSQILTTLIMLANIFSFGQSWYKENLVNYATIEFPNKPQLNETAKGLTQIGYQKNDNYFLVDIEDLSNYGNLEVKITELDNLYKGILIGFFENKEYNLLSQTKFIVQNLTGIEVEYSSNSKNLPKTRFKRLLFFNGKIFSIEFWTTDLNKEKSKKDKERYFNSLKVTLDKSELKQYTSN